VEVDRFLRWEAVEANCQVTGPLLRRVHRW
jgi:hypothetical protein